MVKRSLSALTLMVALLGVAVGPANATQQPGLWWTNHVRCEQLGGYADIQMQYYVYLSGSTKYVVPSRVATYSSRFGYLTRMTVTEYRAAGLPMADQEVVNLPGTSTEHVEITETLSPLVVNGTTIATVRLDYTSGVVCTQTFAIGQ